MTAPLRARFLREMASPGSAVSAWRATTAVRVFAVAMATGTLVSEDIFLASAPILVVVMLVAAVSSLLEWKSRNRPTHWYAVGEAVVIPTVLVATGSIAGLGAYLAVPAAVAGVRHGLVTTLNATLLAGLATAATLAADPSGSAIARGASTIPWLAIGLGVGLLASWQSRSSRDQAARQAPYAAAHHLMGRLHQLASSGALGLDSTTLATDLDLAMRGASGCARSVVFVMEADETLRPLNGGEDVDRLAQEIALPDEERTPGAAVIALRGAQGVLGYCVLVGVPRWSTELHDRAREVADDFAVRLDTAVLFDDVRALAAADERNRIARDMHDGVAQEIVALGYLVDEIESLSDQPDTRELAATLRAEITRLVSEIRFSIFDLRHQVADGRLSSPLADYARETSRASGMRIHLSLEESGPPLHPRVATEVLRVAQEAISNVRKHSHGQNLWVSFSSDGSATFLEIQDDGVGNAAPRDHHWGLQTMRERAVGVGARLDVTPRPGGGTVITLRSSSTSASERESVHGHQRSVG